MAHEARLIGALLSRPRSFAESKVPALTGANEWFNSDPVTAADLRGRVVLVDLRFRR